MRIQADRVIGVVVTYHPSTRTIENIRALTAEIPAIVVDNTPREDSVGVLETIAQLPSVRLIRNGQNRGIAAALNQGIREAIASGCQWVATFDQDSTITPGFVAGLLAACHNHPERSRVMLVAPALYYPESNELEVANIRRLPEASLVQTAMTSGSLIRIEVFQKCGFYDEKMFIDYVDYEHGFRLQRAGYLILRANRVLLHHHLGAKQSRRVLGRTISVKAHSPWRRYYITRNRLHTYRRHGGQFPGWMLRDSGWFLLELAKILVVEDQKLAKLKSICLGAWHGLIGRSGVWPGGNN